MAKQDSATEECSSLLRRMELEVSEEEVDPRDTENMGNAEDMNILEEEVHQTDHEKELFIMEDQILNKNQKRETKWGPTLRIPRPRRGPDDGKTMLEKAQEPKKLKNQEKGKKKLSSFAFERSSNLLKMANAVNISLGNNISTELEKVDSLKLKELADRSLFEDKNPEVTLPANLDTVLDIENFPPLRNDNGSL